MKLIKFSLLGDPDPVQLSPELLSNEELDRYLDAEAAAKRQRRRAARAERASGRRADGDDLDRAA